MGCCKIHPGYTMDFPISTSINILGAKLTRHGLANFVCPNPIDEFYSKPKAMAWFCLSSGADLMFGQTLTRPFVLFKLPKFCCFDPLSCWHCLTLFINPDVCWWNVHVFFWHPSLFGGKITFFLAQFIFLPAIPSTLIQELPSDKYLYIYMCIHN